MSGSLIDRAEVSRRFTFYPPNEERVQRHITIRHALMGAAEVIAEQVPDGREKSLAITKLEEAMFWANAAIAREEA